MPITEDLDVYLADFGVSCTAGATTAKGIFDMPGEVAVGGMVLTTDSVSYTHLTLPTKRIV